MPVFLFNDIEGSTRLWEEYQDAMGGAISRHDAILQSLIGQHGGRILRHRGDGISAVFEDGQPLECAIAVQRQFALEDWGTVPALRIRLALHAGQAERRVFEGGTIGQKEEYFGPVLNRTARVMDAGWGGQILLTPAVVNLYALPPQATLQDLGVHLLKDLHNPQRIYALTHPDLPIKEFPPLRSLTSRAHNLPPQPTPFVGREDERARIAALLADPDCRLLTLVGPGGIGKTRLALQVAAEQIDAFEQGVYAVQLASVTAPDLLIPAIVDALKPPLYGTQDQRAQLLDHLRDKQMLLVLDNFEQVLEAAGVLADVLTHAPKVKLLVTSRQRLNLHGEWLFKIDGMQAAGDGALDSATQLFVQSARRVRPEFALDETTRPAVRRIVELVEGMPLGIELAAAWVQMLSPGEIVSEIESNLDFLVTSLQDVPERHRSLRAVFDQSWNMLSAGEQEVLKRLSALPGGFRHETARRVANVSLPTLLDLVDKSLLRRTSDGRYEMHEFLRQHAKDNRDALPPAANVPAAEARQVVAPPLVETEAATLPAQEETAQPLRNPYKGLRAFQEEDADNFFGRDTLIAQLIRRLSEPDAMARFLAVVGPSGSGKSSVVKAGVIPALRQGALPGSERWVVIEMLPSAYPLEELESALLRATSTPVPELLTQLRQDERGLMRAVKRILPDEPGVELVLVIDQFEELFTLVEDESARFHLLDSLMVALGDPHSRLRAIVTLRADFYDRPLRYAEFGRVMRERTEIVLPLSPDELEQAIVNPAERSGLALGTDLVAAIIADVSEQPGALPLLQYTLTELFERREGRALTLGAYRAVGGVSGALARRAEELYAEMDETRQEATRQLFLRLVTPGEGTEDTRRRVRLAELESLAVAGPAMDAVMRVFSQYRLLTFDRDPVTHGPTVEVAHEALIREWQRLRDWLDASREDLRLHRRLMVAAAEWLNSGKDAGFLVTGSRLAQYEEWIAATDLEFAQEEWDYLVASMAEQEARSQAEQERLRREIELEQRSITLERRSIASERRAANRLRLLVATLVVFLVGAVGLSLFAFSQSAERQDALATSEFNKDLAETQVAIAQTQAGIAEQQAGIARLNSSLLLAASAELALTNRDTDLAILLALQAAEQDAPPEQAARTLFNVADAPGTHARFEGHSGQVSQVAISPDGRRAVSAGADSTVIVWNVEARQMLGRLEGHTDAVTAVQFAPDGRSVVSGSRDGTLIVWNLENGEILARLAGHTDAVTGVALTPDGARALSASRDATLRLWDLATGQELDVLEGHTDAVLSVAASPDGARALSGAQDGTLRLWDLDTGQELAVLEGHTDAVLSVAFSPDGTRALSGAQDGTLRLWDLDTGQEIRRFEGHTGGVTSVAFSADGLQALSASRDGSVRLWSIERGAELLRLLGHSDAVTSAVFSPDGRDVLSGSADMTLRLWELHRGSEMRRLSGHADTVYEVAVSPDGRTAVSASGDGTLIVWDLETGALLRQLEGHQDWVRSVAFSPDGATILSGSYDTTLILWDAATGAIVRRFEGHADRVRAVAFSPDGQVAASGGDDGAVLVWDVATGEVVRRIETGAASVRAVAFSRDGRDVLAGLVDASLVLWDVATGEEQRRFTGHADTVLTASFSPDGAAILSGGADNALILWDAATGQPRATFAHEAPVFGAAFSPDGTRAIAGTNDGDVILWDLATGQQVRRYIGHNGAVYSVAFRPDGGAVVSGSADTRVAVWRIDSSLGALIDWTYANRYVRDITCAEREQYRVEPLCDEEQEQAVAMVSTATPYPTPAPTITPLATASPTALPPTEAPASTPTDLPTATATGTPTAAPSDTLAPAPSQPAAQAESAAVQPPATATETATATLTLTPTVEPSATGTPTASPTVAPSDTSAPADTPTTAPPTATALPGPDRAPVILTYDAQTLVLRNRSGDVIDVSGLTFIQAVAGSERLSFESDDWDGGSQPPNTLPPGDCFQVWTTTIATATLPRPADCGTRHAWREAAPPRWFWISDDPAATFEVRRADDILATCVVGAGECLVSLQPGDVASAAAAPAPTEPATTATLRPTVEVTEAAPPAATPAPSTTPTLAPTATPTATAATPAVTRTPAPTRSASADGPPVILVYDGDAFALINRSDRPVDVSGLTFARTDATGRRLSFSSDQWSGGSQPPSALPPGDCFQIWRSGLASTADLQPLSCARRHAWSEVGPLRWFWFGGDADAVFEVRRDDDLLATCPLGAGTCELPLASEAAPVPVTPLPTTAADALDGAILLTYDDQTLALINRADQPVDVSGLAFIRAGEAGERLVFESDQWSGGSQPPSALPPGDCFQIWTTGLASGSPPRPDGCDTRHAWREVAPSREFWTGGDPGATFEVRRDDDILATCSIGARACAFDLP